MTEDSRFPLSLQKENLPVTTENRVLVLGSRLSGAFKLADDFQEYLKQNNIPDPNVEVLRDAGLIEWAILGRETIAEGLINPRLPKGVILLSEMRQYLHGGMTLHTYRDGVNVVVEELCQKYGIPLIEIREYNTPEQIETGLKKILQIEKEKEASDESY